MGRQDRCRGKGAGWLFAALAALLFLAVTVGRSEAGSTEAGSTEALAEAKDALEAGRYGVAYQVYRKLADLDGNPQAQYYLGVMARDGLGAPQEPLEALNWLEHAAVQGHKPAYYATGQLYFLAPRNPETGRQFPQDIAKAYLWLSAAEKSTSVAEERDTSGKLRELLIDQLPPNWLPELDSLVDHHLEKFRGS